MKPALIVLLLSGPVAAADCPDVPDHSAALDALVADLQDAPDDQAARRLSAEMWQYWKDAPDARAQALLDEGIARLAASDHPGALDALDALVAYCPDYAEGYNQRAFVNYLRRDYAAALPDLDRAIARAPRHVAALAGRALTLIGLGRRAEAALSLRAALALNPWLAERRLLPALEADEEEL